MDFAEQFGEEVKLTGASNALLFQNQIIARNTDFLGFLKSFNFHFTTAPKKVLVIGGGGIGRAVSARRDARCIIERDRNSAGRIGRGGRVQSDRVGVEHQIATEARIA